MPVEVAGVHAGGEAFVQDAVEFLDGLVVFLYRIGVGLLEELCRGHLLLVADAKMAVLQKTVSMIVLIAA